jgi:hypothetical protein
MHAVRSALERTEERLGVVQAPDASAAAAIAMPSSDPFLTPISTSSGQALGNLSGQAPGQAPVYTAALPELARGPGSLAVPLNARGEDAGGPTPMDLGPGPVGGGTAEAGRQMRPRRRPVDPDLVFPSALSHPMFAGLAGIRAPDQVGPLSPCGLVAL